jgi:hypothetical protein
VSSPSARPRTFCQLNINPTVSGSAERFSIVVSKIATG